MTRLAFAATDVASPGPFSHAVRAGDLLYLSGQTAIDPATWEHVEGDVEVHLRRVFTNLESVLRAAGLTLDDIVKVNVYLTDMADISVLNTIFPTLFRQPYPARTTVAVAALPFGAKVEVEAVAQFPAA